ncbi:MAG: hypothetical protein JWO36_1762 [Myxococcales bacterium]|nr:hypothetical protein [Myxococcales bacterium]
MLFAVTLIGALLVGHDRRALARLGTRREAPDRMLVVDFAKCVDGLDVRVGRRLDQLVTERRGELCELVHARAAARDQSEHDVLAVGPTRSS